MYLYVSLIAGLTGLLGGAALFWALQFHPLGGAVCAPIPSILTWLILVHFMRPPTWRRTLCAGLLSPLLGTALLLFLPIGLIVMGWYVAVPVGVITAIAIRSVLLAHPQEFVDFPACAKCGYNITGNTSGVCPECGTPLDRPAFDVADSSPTERSQSPV